MKHVGSLAAAAVMALAACGGGGAPPVPAVSTAPAYGAPFLRNARLIGPAKVSIASVTVALQLPNERALLAAAAAVNDRHNAQYRRFLTPDEIGRRFGASPTTIADVTQYFNARGLRVSGSKLRQSVVVSGLRADLERALGTRFGMFARDGQTFLGPQTSPRLSRALPIRTIFGLVGYEHRKREIVVNSVSSETGPFGFGYSPFEIASAFDFTGAYAATFRGGGITVGIIGTGPILPGDVPAFKSMYGLGGSGTVTETALTAAPYSSPPPVTKPCFGTTSDICNGEDGEAQLETEQVAALAPDANILFYTGYNAANPGRAGSTLPYVYDELTQAVTDNIADILVLGFGGSEGAEVAAGGIVNADGSGPIPDLLASAALAGIATFAATGDSGAEACYTTGPAANVDAACATYPGDDPNVVGVGGTTTPIGTNGRFTGPITAWGQQTLPASPQVPAGSGGGISTIFAVPPYQAGVATIQGGMRNTPDVSFNADPATGVTVLGYGDPSFAGSKSLSTAGGTSAAAPAVAAMWALVLGACATAPACATGPSGHPYRLGNPDSRLYGVAANGAAYASTFYDVVFGSNAQPNSCIYTATCPMPGPTPSLDPGYAAGVGYDDVTGLGVPFARALIRSVTGQ